jgi:hypothetical protein
MQEIGNLTRLKNLKDLRFSDPQWGDSPLALLHNYWVCKLPLFRKISSLFLHAYLQREREVQIMEATLFSHPTLGFLVGRWLHLLPSESESTLTAGCLCRPTFCLGCASFSLWIQWILLMSVSKLPKQCTHASVYTTTCASSPCNRLATVASHPLPKLTCAESKPCKSEVCYDFHTQQRYCISSVNEFWSKFVMGTRYILALDNRDIPVVSP